MNDAVELAEVPEVFERWLAGRPLAGTRTSIRSPLRTEQQAAAIRATPTTPPGEQRRPSCPHPAARSEWRQTLSVGFARMMALPLPARDVILVEGFRLLPDLVGPYLSDVHHAVWLIPTPDFRQAAFAARDRSQAFWLATADPQRALANLLTRDEIFSDRITADAARNGLRTLAIDDAPTVDVAADALAKHFALRQ